MSQGALTFLSIIAYVGGQALLIKMTPQLFIRNFDEGLFMGIAAAVVLGSLLVFAAVGITFAAFNGAFGIRVLDFLLLIGIIVVAARLSLRGLRPAGPGRVIKLSGYLAGSYCLLVFLAACYGMIMLFVTPL